jgi:hypothetical protein
MTHTVSACLLSIFLLLSCLVATNCGGGKSEKGLPVGSACTQDSQCAGPGVPDCLTDGLFPLARLADSENPTAKGLAGIGVPLPGGYCSNVPPCATDADCGEGGTCFFPLKNVDETYFKNLVAALGLPPADAAVLEGFLTYGQCLLRCETQSNCPRTGYVCATPLDDFLSLVQGADRSTFCIGEAPGCDPECQHGTCDLAAQPPVCKCESGWSGAACDQNIDDCNPNPCQNGGTCADLVADYRCSCPNGYTGKNCETVVQACADSPCVHGTCQDTGPGTFSCTCEPGWEGTLCDQNIDDCDPNPCQNGGTCADLVADYRCSCPNGYTGKNCETVGQGCADSPCVHGTCQDTGPGTFSCTCEPGWEGTLCDQNIDDCDPNPCQNGGTCADEVNGFSCDCSTAPGWTGDLCDEPIPTTHCVLTYTLTPGNANDGTNWTGCNLRIRDTTGGLGDGTHAVGPGTLVLRVPSDGGQNPAAGTVEVLYYHLSQHFVQSTFGTTITTDVDAASPSLGATDNTTPVAIGTLTLGANPEIAWASCTYPAGYNNTNTSFTPDVVGTGAGCLAPYRSTGNVNCSGTFCSTGGLQNGDNPQDETWEQAMNPLTFTGGLASFRMNTLMLVPNRSPSRTYLSWEGTLQGMPLCQ